MKLLEDMIKKYGEVRPGNVLKVDGFLNHRIDVGLVKALGEELYKHFRSDKITKILTIESSGIADQCDVFVADEISAAAVERVIGSRIGDFTLVIGSDDRIACQLLRVLAARGVRVPAELSVIGWNNSRFLEYLTPSLSSVAIPMCEIGRRAAEIILQNLNDGPSVVKEYVDEEIFLRESFAPCKVGE